MLKVALKVALNEIRPTGRRRRRRRRRSDEAGDCHVSQKVAFR